MPFDKEEYWAKRNAPKPIKPEGGVLIPATTIVCGNCMDHKETRAKAWRGPFVTVPGRPGVYYHSGCPWSGRIE